MFLRFANCIECWRAVSSLYIHPTPRKWPLCSNFTLPAVTLRRNEDLMFVNKLRENYLVLRLYKWAIIACIFYQVSCVECYENSILRVEQFRKTDTSFVIPNSKLSMTVYILRRNSYLLEQLNSLSFIRSEPNLIV